MTKDEWLQRCAARYASCADLTHEQAMDAALATFDANDEQGFEFSEIGEYSPENCADEDMSCWTDDGE